MEQIARLKRNIWLLLIPFIIFGAFLVYVLYIVSGAKHTDIDQQQGRSIIGSVLGVSKDAQLGLFAVNIPAQFSENVKLKDKNLDAGSGKVLASNLIYSLEGGAGIEITGGQSPVIVNSDPGSNQNIFKSIRVGNQTIDATSNSDTFEIASTNGLTLDVQGKKLTFTGLEPVATTIDNSVTTIINTIDNSSVTNTTVENTSGLIRDTGQIYLENLGDSLEIGTSGSGAKLAVKNNSDQVGLLFESSAAQTANISEWRDSNGNLLVSFDKDGNASFNGKVVQSGFELKDTNVSFSSDNQNVLLDIKTMEPENLLLNPGLEIDLVNWTSNTPSAINQATNSQMLTNLNGWTGEVVGGSFPELLSNTGLESDLTGWTFDNGGLTTTTFNLLSATNARQILTGPDNNLWVTHYDGRISKVTTEGTITEYNVGGNPVDLVIGADGNLWYLDETGPAVRQIATNGTIVTSISIPSGGDVTRMTSGADGNLWVISRQNRKVFRITLTGTITSFNTYNNDEGRDIHRGSDGNIWVTSGSMVGTISGTGVYNMFSASWSCDAYMASGVDGNVWYTSTCGVGDGYMTSSGINTNVDSGGDETYGVAAGPDGNMWFTRYIDNEIIRYRMNGTVTHISLPAGGYGITAGPDNNIWAVVGGNTVVRVSLGLPEIVTNPTFASSAGALRVNQNVNYSYLFQNKTLDADKRYELACYVYKSPTDTIDSSIASLSVNGAAIATTFTNSGGGWYLLTSRFAGSGAAADYGIRISPNNVVIVDNCSLKQVPEQYVTSPAFSLPGGVMVAAPGGNDAIYTQSTSFTSEVYSIKAYVYTDGSPVTSADVQMYFGTTALNTTFTLSSTPGWYLAEATITPSSEGVYDFGVLVKSGKTVYADDFSLLFANLSQRVWHSTQLPKYLNSAGAGHINALGTTQISFTQSITLNADEEYTLVAHIYNNTPGSIEGQIDSSIAQLIINGNPVAGASYTLSTEGFYELSKNQFLTSGTYTVGVRISSGYRVVVDAIYLQAGTGDNKTLNITNSGSGLAFLNVESTTYLNAGRGTRQALIITGAVDQTVNLTEWRDSSANVLTVVSKDGNIGIGDETPTSGLSIIKSSTSVPGLAVVNSNDGDAASVQALRLALGTQTTGVNSRFITFYAGSTDEVNGTGVGAIRLNNGGVAYESGGADFAEYFDTDERLEPGDVVYIKSNGNVGKTTNAYEQATLGIVSDSAAFVGNSRGENEGKVLVGLVGQIQVKVSNVNGKIKKGDYIASSSIAGTAARAIKDGVVIGIALEDQTEDTAKVMVRPGYHVQE